MPRGKPNSVYRTREHLTGAEVDRLIDAAKANRWGHRDATMILVAFRHGLRSSELVDLRWDQIDFSHAVLHVRRAKKGTPATHPVVGDEMRALRKLQREQEPKSPFVFTSERGSPFTTAGFARMVERADEASFSAIAGLFFSRKAPFLLIFFSICLRELFDGRHLAPSCVRMRTSSRNRFVPGFQCRTDRGRDHRVSG